MAYEDAKLSNYAAVDKIPSMTELTVDAWVQSKYQDRRSGTILSYAVADESSTEVMDNALTIMDPSNVRIFVNGHTIYTDLEIDDGAWHRITFSWSGSSGGTYL